jgi:murein DD-endopeptidase MepM/ murein hydrolase activator NlpD
MRSFSQRRRAARLLLPLILSLSCGVEERISDLLHSDSPYEEYLGRLRQSGLDQTALGRDWVRAGETALAAAAAASTPFQETGYFPPETPGAVAWRLELRRGRTLAIELRFDAARPARVFLDLFSVRDTNPPSRVASLKEDSTALRYQVRRDGVYILRLQPELLRGGRWTLVQRTEASLGFPVPGFDVKAVKSRFGVDRDAGRRRHHGLDIFAPRGTAVVALVDGYARPGTNPLGGNVVWLTDGRRNLYYAHLDRWAFQDDAQVRVGDTLGYIGNTGNARTTPPHLHFGIYDNGPVDPFPFLAPDDPSPPAPTRPPEEWNQWVRVTAREAVLRSGAGRDADTLLRLERGGLARVIAASHRAVRVLLPDESTGYLDPQALTSVAAPLLRTRLDSGTVLREFPGDRAPAVERVTGAVMGDVLGRFGEFALVRVPEAGTGWVAAHMIGLPPSCCQR